MVVSGSGNELMVITLVFHAHHAGGTKGRFPPSYELHESMPRPHRQFITFVITNIISFCCLAAACLTLWLTVALLLL